MKAEICSGRFLLGFGPGCGGDFGDVVVGQMREAGEDVTEGGLKKLQVSSFKFHAWAS